MSSWISSLAEKARKAVDNLADTLVEQANAAQEQIINEQKKVKEEVAKQAKLHDDAALPWETDDEELGILSQDVMEKVFALSLTEQNFTIPPPKLEILPFVFSDKVAVAMRLLALDTNLARMHSKLSPKMDEEIFWQHYFFRVEYIRLRTGIEKIGPSDVQLMKIKDIPEDDIIYKPTFVPPPKPASQKSKGSSSSLKAKAGGAASSGAGAGAKGSKAEVSGLKLAKEQVDTSLDSGPDPLDDLDVDDDDEDDAAAAGVSKKEIEERRKAEAALAAEVEAELDNDDIDLGDLEDFDLDNIGDEDFDDLGDMDLSGDGAGGDDDDDLAGGGDDDIEAEIERELKQKAKVK